MKLGRQFDPAFGQQRPVVRPTRNTRVFWILPDEEPETVEREANGDRFKRIHVPVVEADGVRQIWVVGTGTFRQLAQNSALFRDPDHVHAVVVRWEDWDFGRRPVVQFAENAAVYPFPTVERYKYGVVTTARDPRPDGVRTPDTLTLTPRVEFYSPRGQYAQLVAEWARTSTAHNDAPWVVSGGVRFPRGFLATLVDRYDHCIRTTPVHLTEHRRPVVAPGFKYALLPKRWAER